MKLFQRAQLFLVLLPFRMLAIGLGTEHIIIIGSHLFLLETLLPE